MPLHPHRRSGGGSPPASRTIGPRSLYCVWWSVIPWEEDRRPRLVHRVQSRVNAFVGIGAESSAPLHRAPAGCPGSSVGAGPRPPSPPAPHAERCRGSGCRPRRRVPRGELVESRRVRSGGRFVEGACRRLLCQADGEFQPLAPVGGEGAARPSGSPLGSRTSCRARRGACVTGDCTYVLVGGTRELTRARMTHRSQDGSRPWSPPAVPSAACPTHTCKSCTPHTCE